MKRTAFFGDPGKVVALHHRIRRRQIARYEQHSKIATQLSRHNENDFHDNHYLSVFASTLEAFLVIVTTTIRRDLVSSRRERITMGLVRFIDRHKATVPEDAFFRAHIAHNDVVLLDLKIVKLDCVVAIRARQVECCHHATFARMASTP